MFEVKTRSRLEVERYVYDKNVPVIHNPCPADGKTNRQDMKEFVAELNRNKHGVKEQIFHAIANSEIDGWRVENEG